MKGKVNPNFLKNAGGAGGAVVGGKQLEAALKRAK